MFAYGFSQFPDVEMLIRPGEVMFLMHFGTKSTLICSQMWLELFNRPLPFPHILRPSRVQHAVTQLSVRFVLIHFSLL